MRNQPLRWRERFGTVWRRHPGFALTGMCVSLIVSAFLWMVDQPFLKEGFTPESAGAFAPVILTLLFLLLLCLFTNRGRAFVVGFLAVVLALTVVTAGKATKRWMDPINYVVDVYREHSRDQRIAGVARAADAQWVAEMRRTGMDSAEGARRALYLRGCMQTYRAKSQAHGFPLDSMMLSHAGVGCRSLDGYYRAGQSGWRWRYTAPPAGSADFNIDMYPEPALGLDGPLFSLDARGIVLQRARRGAPPFAFYSVMPAFNAARECVQYARANAKSVRLGVVSLRGITEAHLKPCEGLQMEQPNDSLFSNDDNAMRVPLPFGAKGWNVVARHVLLFRPRNSTSDGAFDLFLRPTWYGSGNTRSYALLADGTLHVTTEDRQARSGDPPPLPCELNLLLACDPI